MLGGGGLFASGEGTTGVIHHNDEVTFAQVMWAVFTLLEEEVNQGRLLTVLETLNPKSLNPYEP